MSITLSIDFTATHDTTVNQTIADTLCNIQQDIRQLTNSEDFTVYMGGGYGRGEGGVLITEDNRHLPYNDIDFFVFTHLNSRRKRQAFDDGLRQIGRKYSRRLGIAFDFAPAKALDKFRREQHTLMYQELLYRHVLVYGTDLLAGMECSPAHELPVQEGLKLLVNRGMGLLLAIHQLAEHPESEETLDFVARNLHKTAQGAGDALLMAQRRYDYDFQRRRMLILYEAKTNPAFKELAPLYKAAIDFKVLPSVADLASPAESCARYAHLWFEAARHFVAFTTDRTPSILQTPAQLSDCIYRQTDFRGRGPFINALRWIAKTKTVSPLRLLPRNPTARIFSLLCLELFDICEKSANLKDMLDSCAHENNKYDFLVCLWRIFN